VTLQAEKAVKISTTCTVFAESEVVSWLGKGKKIEDILLGVHQSIVSRSLGLMRRVGIESEVTFTGGVTRNLGVVTVLNAMLGQPVNVSDESHYMGALGAALFAMDRIMAGRVPAGSGDSHL
jgi:activator of 2-hydroxyglutaryl-CoA dehydratase